MSIRKFRKRMKPFILVITIVFLLSLAFGGYQSYQTSRANKKAQEAFNLNGKYVNKVDIEREKGQIADTYGRNGNVQIEKDLIDILAFNEVIKKELILELADDLKIKVSSDEVDKEYKNAEEAIGDKAQFKRMLEFQGLTKASYKEKIEEELVIKKTLENFVEQVKPTEEEIKYYYDFNINDKSKTLEESKEEVVKAIQSIEGLKKFQEAIGEKKKDIKIKNVSKEYENLVEKVIYTEEGFDVTNLDLANEELRETLRLGKADKIEKEKIEKTAKEMITKGIKAANIAKTKGITVNDNLPLTQKILEYRIGLLKKYREEVKVNDEELKSFFNANEARYKINAYADANMAFIKIKGSEEDEKLAKEAAEKVLKEVNTENFDAKGKELSTEKGYIYEDLGTFSKGMMVKEFEEAVKETSSMSITKNVVKTGFGYHVVFVKENNSKEGKWTVSHILVRVEPSQKTIDEKMTKLEKLKEDLEKGAVSFTEIQKLDEDIIQNVKIDGITPDGNIPNIGYNKEITDKIFKEELNKVGIMKSNSIFVLFQKVKEVEAQNANFEKSKNQVRNDFINYKALGEMMKIFYF